MLEMNGWLQRPERVRIMDLITHQPEEAGEG